MALVDINNPSNYKPCSKKQYEIWVCMPPKGTIVFNKLEQSQAIARLKQIGVKGLVGDIKGCTWFAPPTNAVAEQTYNELLSFIQQTGQGYVVSDKKPFVLSGTEGEMWLIDPDKLASTYVFLENGQPAPINDAIVRRRLDQAGNMPWYKVRTKPTVGPATTMACFLPKNQQAKIQTSWGDVLCANDPNSPIKHGKGDFIVCDRLPDGKPNLSSRRVVNGLIFGATYNNQGFADCLMPVPAKGRDILRPVELFFVVTKSDIASKPKYNPDIYNFVGRVLQECARNQHQELKFAVQKSKEKENEIIVNATVINDYAVKHSVGEGLDGRATPVIKDKCTHVTTKILVGENEIEFTQYDRLASGASNYSFKFSIPATKEGCEYLSANRDIVIGLLGYVRGDVSGLFNMSGLTKRDYDALSSYTNSSGTINALCRACEATSGRWAVTGEDRALGYRSIRDCDYAFDKIALQRPVTVFRGVPCDKRFMDATGRNFENLPGAYEVNDAYSSTTLNAQSAPMFASRNTQQGIILAITLPAGTRCCYVHNIAGWVQQYEILLDRCYDIRYGDVILEFKDSAQKHYKVVKAELAPHQPFGQLTRQSCLWYGLDSSGRPSGNPNHSGNKVVHNYNECGKTPVEIGEAMGVLHDAFEILRNKGFTDVQWQSESVSYIGEPINESIVLHTKDEGDGKHIDLAFSLVNSQKQETRFALKVTPVMSDDSANSRFKYNGAKDMSWSTYNAGSDIVEVYYKNGKRVTDAAMIEAKDYDETRCELQLPPESDVDKINSKVLLQGEVKYIELAEDTPNAIATRIYRFAQANKNICLAPLVDVARYFDLTFRAAINQEGYELLRSARIERVGKENDNQDGYVPLKYMINGDNDDNLTIVIKFSRRENGRLKISFAGRSNNNSVNEEKNLTYAIFNNEAMQNLSLAIIYTFARKLHLSKARKIDSLIGYFCRNTGYTSVRIKQGNDSDSKKYKIWNRDRSNYFEFQVTKIDAELYNATIVDRNGVTYKPFELNTQKTIFELYRDLCTCIKNYEDDAVAQVETPVEQVQSTPLTREERAKLDAEKLLKAAVDDGFYSQVYIEEEVDYYRVYLERDGANGCGVIDCYKTKEKTYGYFLEDFCNETKGHSVNPNNPDSVSRMLEIINFEFMKV